MKLLSYTLSASPSVWLGPIPNETPEKKGRRKFGETLQTKRQPILVAESHGERRSNAAILENHRLSGSARYASPARRQNCGWIGDGSSQPCHVQRPGRTR